MVLLLLFSLPFNFLTDDDATIAGEAATAVNACAADRLIGGVIFGDDDDAFVLVVVSNHLDLYVDLTLYPPPPPFCLLLGVVNGKDEDFSLLEQPVSLDIELANDTISCVVVAIVVVVATPFLLFLVTDDHFGVPFCRPYGIVACAASSFVIFVVI